MSEMWTQAEIEEATASHGQDMEIENLTILRTEAYAKLLAAEKAWHKYFCALPIGKDREHAHEVFENVRCATRL